MQEFIICAAVRNKETGKIWYGHRHAHCLQAANDELSWTLSRQQICKIKIEQGFITSQNRFVDRDEGLNIALLNNQVLDKSEIRGNQLYSEDIY